MNETTSMPHAFGSHDGGSRRAPSFDSAGIGPIELRVYREAWLGWLEMAGGPGRRLTD
jgi:hypothetical protein